MRLILALALLVASPAYAEVPSMENLPARLSCPVVRVIYRHYAKQGFTADQMAAFMRSKGISEPKIAKLAQCIKQA